ncbi:MULTISPECIES: hypothetical protein [unclassified Treponema]|uniref:hypothetical protein n=1 Tax=unclassified Treponema TaxID=2638727 RepID=UPI0020A2BB08|nr:MULTISPECIES: hypothetical protein [unclassified Treponema]UTC68100.1 hypothetical protein E4O06_05530 [Treponema sp. OMZ 789]UTC70822.1 hypothetical protein E4O01_05675 [Treponema sp. OMZ 790]UTC73562.1 hypothetical protein E4O02_05870 [Treponema sp. OMZ 791]
MGKLLHIGMLAFLGISFACAAYYLYHNYKNTIVNGKRLIDEPVNENTKAGKLSIGEIFVYGLMFVIAILFIIQIIYKGTKFPSATAVLIRTIFLVPIMAVFNARKRTGKAMVALFGSLLFLLFCMMTYLIIGLPVKSPILTINNTKIKLGQTIVKELMNDGFDIYMETGHATMSDHRDFPYSDEFEKYSDSMDISIAKGYHWQSTKIVPYSKGVLAKNNMAIAEIIFYGNMKKDTPLQDCSIIHFTVKSFYIEKMKKEGISMKLNGVDLFSKIEMDTMKKTFARKIFRPNKIETDKRYIISWDSRSHHLFYNSYAATIDMDDDYFANDIELVCQIAREAD